MATPWTRSSTGTCRRSPASSSRAARWACSNLEQDDGEGGRERNDRLLAIPLHHPRGDELRTIEDVAERVRDELAHFFTSTVFFEPKNPKVLGWKGPSAADAMIR